MLKKINFLYLFSLFFCFCQSESDLTKPEVKEVRIKIGDINNTKNFSEIFDDLEYITLDSSAPISQIIDLEITEENIILLERTLGLERNLYIYNRQGKLLRKLVGNSRGPGGFIGAYDFLVDRENSIIQVLDVTQRKIVSFNMKGQLIGEIPTLDNTVFHFFVKHPLSKQYIFHCGNEITTNERYNIFYISEDLKKISSKSQYIPNHILSMGFTYSPFTQSNTSDIYYKEWYNDTVFYLSENALIPKYHLTFDDNVWLTEDQLSRINRNNISYIVNEIERNPKIISEIKNFIEKENHLLLGFNYDENRYWCTYDKRTGESEFFLPGENDLDYGINPSIWQFTANGNIVFRLDPAYTINFYRNLYENSSSEELDALMKTDFKKFASIVSELNENSNPVLMIARFRKGF